jgi:hypothetical protein
MSKARGRRLSTAQCSYTSTPDVASIDSTPRARIKRSGALVALCVGLLFAQPHGRAQTADALKFFKNFFLTGDYVVAGVGLRGLGGQSGSPAGIATGTISISGVPADADIVAAFLYWQIVTKDSLGPDSGAVGATFNSFALSSADGPFSKVLVSNGTSPCWSSGGGTGSQSGTLKTYTYRADVRRFLNVDADGRFVGNGNYTVQVPDSGPNGNTVPIALGASLVLVYRDPRLPFNAIVIYDGGYTMNQSQDSMTQTIKGFYQAAGTTGRITHIVGSGQANKMENLRLPGTDTLTNSSTIVNPFAAIAGANWDNPTYNLTNVAVSSSPQYGDSVTTSVDHLGFGTFDCLSWGAVIFRTAAKDSDGDGELDLWETASGLTDPNGHALPNLPAMGADPNTKDLFVELGYMKTDAQTTYGSDLRPAHKHMPYAEALKRAGDAFLAKGIKAHFDVGNRQAYHGLGPDYAATGAGAGVDDYLLPSDFARGGEAIDESVTACPAPDCQFPNYPGTVGWKVGFKYFRDQLLSPSKPPLDANGDDPCDVESVYPGNDDGPGGVCERRFDRNRMHMFHYALGAHFVGLPVSEYPCLHDSDPNSTTDPLVPVPAAGSSGACSVGDVINPDFHKPRTISGIADFPGGDVMIVLGGFLDNNNKPVGTAFMQGATLMHELGHNFDLSHAGVYTLPRVTPPDPNCKPNYLSIMNYLFQLRGLYNNILPGSPQMDYSGEVLGSINESYLLDGPLNGTPRYLTGWYAPQSAYTLGSPATKHCDGTPLLRDANGTLTEVPMVRVDGPLVVGGAIDWNPDPSVPSGTAQDVNFDGTVASDNPNVQGASIDAGANDWNNLRLNQLASRRNVLGLSIQVDRDELGRDGLGRDGLGRDGLGRDGLGRDGLGRDGLGRDGLGRDGLGRDGLGRDGLGRDGLGRDGLGRDVDELDTTVAAGSGYAPPNSVTVCVVGVGSCAATGTGQLHRNRVDWQPSTAGLPIFKYHVYRIRDGQTLAQRVEVGTTTDLFLVDATELPDGVRFAYIVQAEFADGPPHTFSGPSTPPVFVTVRNDAPAAANDAYVMQGSTLTITAPGVLANDTDVDSPATSLRSVRVSGPANGTLTLNANGSFTYTPAATFSGTDTFTYNVYDGCLSPEEVCSGSTTGSVTIAVTKVQYGFVNVQNLPPPAGKSFKPGSSVPLAWQWTLNGGVIDTPDADSKPSIQITRSTGATQTFTPADPGSSSFQYFTSTKTHQFNWQTQDTNGTALPTGTYIVYVINGKTGQTWGPFSLTLK